MNIRGWLTALVFKAVGRALQLLFGYRFEGIEHLPTEGPFILIPKEGGGPLAMFSIAFSFTRGLEEPVHLKPPAEVQAAEGFQGPKRHWGIPQLLWQCPVCHTDDALLHKRPRFRPEILDCRACGTLWQVQRIPGKDYRLKVVAGHPDVVGLDMALSAWYDEMRAGFQLRPISVGNLELPEGEAVYLKADGVALVPYKPSALFEQWTSGEAPRAQPGGQDVSPGWEDIGAGQLLVTNERLLWKGSQGDLEFRWPAFRAVFLAWLGIIGITYGSAMYRFDLGPEPARKWLAYVGTLAQEAAELEGRSMTLSPF